MWEFRRDPEELTEQEKQKLEGLFRRLPRLRSLYQMRVRFRKIFDNARDRRKAQRDLVGLFLDMLDDFPELDAFIRTYEAWEEEILPVDVNLAPGGRSMSMVTVAMAAYQALGPAHGCPHQAGIPTGTLAKTQPRESPENPQFAPYNGRAAKLQLISTGNISNRDLEALVVPLIPDIVREFQTHSFLELGPAGIIIRG